MPNRMWWVIGVAIVFLGAAFVTLRAAERVGGTPAVAHPPPSAPEESATIADDPTTAPDAAQSADNNVSFPTDI
jgi:hypothetical protein